MAHIRLPKFRDEERKPLGRSAPLPQRDPVEHGTRLRTQLSAAVEAARQARAKRPPDLPDLPTDVQVVLQSSVTDTGRALLQEGDIPASSWGVEVLEQRQDGDIIALSRDPGAGKLVQRLQWYRDDARTASGRRKGGVAKLSGVDDIPVDTRSLRTGDELAQVPIDPEEMYVVDIEVAAGSERPDGDKRRSEFARYLADGGGVLVGSGPIIEEDYCLFRAFAPGRLVDDMLEAHPWITFVELPPTVEREGMQLLNIQKPELPALGEPEACPPVVAVDGWVAAGHPLLSAATQGSQIEDRLPMDSADPDSDGARHGTAISSVIALGSLREALLGQGGAPPVVPVFPVRVLDHDCQLPESINLKGVLGDIAQDARGESGACVVNHSIASTAPFRQSRMSVWAEALDRVAYDDGAGGFLIVVATGNIDGKFTPTLDTVSAWLEKPGHPEYLLDERCRLRNPAQAINALTVGAYVPDAQVHFYKQQRWGFSPVAGNRQPSPFTRTGAGYLGEVKPEVVEEGGNWYVDGSGRLITQADVTDVAVANPTYATDGRLVRFTNGTSVAAARVSHLAGRIHAALPSAGVDLIRALVVTSAEWPEQLGSAEAALRIFGYGVPRPHRALEPGGARCLIVIEEEILVGHAQYFRIPFPRDLFEADPEVMLRVSVALSYRAPVRKTNLRYRGTIMEWTLSKPGEALAQLRKRCATIGSTDEGDEAIEDAPVGDWGWTVGKRRRTRGTAQKDWFEAHADGFEEDLYLAVVARRGWVSKQQQDQGFLQRYAAAIAIEVEGIVVPIHEEIEARVRAAVRVAVPANE